MVRKLKHHEQKLLKKVDFLAVRAFVSESPYTVSDPRGSGSRMPTYARSKSSAGTTFSTERTTTSRS